MPKPFEKLNIEEVHARLEKLHREFGKPADAVEAERLLHELAVHQVELEMQNAELLTSQQELAESRDRYADLYDFAPIGYLTFDSKGRMVEINLAAAGMLGAERARLTNWPFATYLAKADSKKFYAHLRQVFESDTIITVELTLKRGNGNYVVVRLESTAVPVADNTNARCRSAMLDITERKRAEAELKRSRDHLDALVQQRTLDLSQANQRLQDASERLSEAQRIAGIGSWENDLLQDEGKWSDECFRILGYAPQSVEPSYRHFMERVYPDDREKVEESVKDTRPGHEHIDVEFRVIKPDGVVRLLHSLGKVVFSDNGRALRVVGTVQDITEQRRAEEHQRQAATVFERTHEGILIFDAKGNIVDANPAFSKVTGYTLAQVAGKTLRMLQSKLHDEAFYQAKWKSLYSCGDWEGELWIRRSNGESLTAWTGITAVQDDAGQVVNYVAVLADITPLKKSQEQLAHLAQHDSLTGLTNRLRLAGDLDHALRRAKRHGQKLAVLFLDLDRFKETNDTLGHEAGDRLLQGVSQRLRDSVRAEDTVARWGGDEFVIVLDEVAHIKDAAQLANKVIETITQPIRVDGSSVQTSVSIGISFYPDDAGNVDDLLRTADIAMYHAKEQGRGRYCFYTPELTESNR